MLRAEGKFGLWVTVRNHRVNILWGFQVREKDGEQAGRNHLLQCHFPPI
ncbi:MAG: hypothetical protein KME26_12855 [Oscillatoria princeps RMCB-10]|nr:hypothetical protein [Oscillatoria princeps RMCB-10]